MENLLNKQLGSPFAEDQGNLNAYEKWVWKVLRLSLIEMQNVLFFLNEEHNPTWNSNVLLNCFYEA